MSSISRGNFKMALASVRSTKARSLLTMFGIIVGIVSVVTLVGIGEGVKAQISHQVGRYGNDLITIRPGDVSSSSTKKVVTSSDALFGLNALSGLSAKDVDTVSGTSGISQVAPLGVVSGNVSSDTASIDNSLVIATSPDLPQILKQSIQYGDFFDDSSDLSNAVIGQSVADRLFGESVPLGRTFNFRGQTFTVRGVFSDFASSPLSPTATFNNAIFIPYKIVPQITQGNAEFYTILAKPSDAKKVKPTIAGITSRLKSEHGGQKDFSVLNAQQAVAASSNVIDLLSTFIMVVAGVSLLMGGIGLMNIMLVSVTERMHEIGIRKAVGATSQQILGQFILEAVVLTGVGSVVGVIVAVATNLLLRTYTSYRPVISWQAILLATGISIVVGVVFGAAPAIKAARKDPIEALRHE